MGRGRRVATCLIVPAPATRAHEELTKGRVEGNDSRPGAPCERAKSRVTSTWSNGPSPPRHRGYSR